MPSLAIVKHITSQQDRKRTSMCNITLWGVCLSSSAKETQQCVVCVLLSYMSLSTIYNIIKLSVVTGTQRLIHVIFLSSYKVFRTGRYSCSIITKPGVSRQILITVSNIIFHEIPNIGSRVDICEEIYGRTQRS
jgi:hypothetical protein